MITAYIWFCVIILALCTIVIAYLSLVVTRVEWEKMEEEDADSKEAKK